MSMMILSVFCIYSCSRYWLTNAPGVSVEEKCLRFFFHPLRSPPYLRDLAFKTLFIATLPSVGCRTCFLPYLSCIGGQQSQSENLHRAVQHAFYQVECLASFGYCDPWIIRRDVSSDNAIQIRRQVI